MTIVTDVYELNLAMSGKLKLRASARFAEGGSDATFEACVLLHEAARIERRALTSLPSCSPSTRLLASIEECWCLVEGRDPALAGRAWGHVLQNLRRVDDATGAAMLVRLRPRFEASESQLRKVLSGCKHLIEVRSGGALVPPSKEGRAAAYRDVKKVLEVFPGASSFWWASYRLLDAAGDKKGAWGSLSRARRLQPDNHRFHAMSLLTATKSLPAKEADAYLNAVRSSVEELSAEVCLMYAHAEIELAKKEDQPRARWERALHAANAGFSKAGAESLRRILRATQLLLTALLAGEAPKVDILYLAGLSEAAATHPSGRSVADTVEYLASWNVAANDVANEAA